MGVEAWLYDRLGRPLLQIVGETSDDPTRLPVPNWIALADAPSAAAGAPVNSPAELRSTAAAGSNGEGTKSASTWPRTIFKGGCDLDQIIDYLGRRGRIDREFNYKNDHGAGVHREHTEVLRRCVPETLERYGDVIDRIVFLDRRAFTTAMFDDRYEVIVYSTLMDLSQGLYRFRGTDLVIAFTSFSLDMAQPDTWRRLRKREPWMNEDFIDWFCQNFEFLGGLSADDFRRGLHWLAGRIAPPKQLILLNGSEIKLEHELEPDRWRHHAAMNAVIDEVAAQYPHVDVCDVRLVVNRPDQIVDNIRHYRRGVYFQLARQIEQLVADHHALNTNPIAIWLNGAKAVVRNALWKANRRLFGPSKAPRKG